MGTIATFGLQSAAGGTAVPFALGHVFRKGDAPAGQVLTLNTASAQITPISTWDDGSVKHALVAGKASLSAGVKKTVTLGAGAASSGTTLTEAHLAAANPSASVSYGSYGTVSLAALLNTSARVLTEHAGPEYAAFQYVAAFPNDSGVRAVFYVQLWAGGSYRVRVAVENGTALTTSAAKNGSATVSIAGATAYSGSVAMPQGVRWDAVGASTAIAIASHDAAYLRASKLVPNYGYRSPGSATLAALSSSYAPMARLGWEQDMGATGYTQGIGLLPHWDALYAATGDVRALDSSVAHARALGSYSVFYRDNNTRAMPRYSSYPTAVNGAGGGDQEGMNGAGTNSNRWEFAHHPNAGYLAWLMTGERFHLEVLQANAWAAWFTDGGSGAGVNRLFSSQTRGRAWRFRTIACAAAVSPDGDAFKADCKASIVANLNHWRSQHVAPNTPATGLGATYDDQESGTAGLQRGLFEHLFLVASIGWSWDLELKLNTAERTVHRDVRDYFYRVPVGLAGSGPANGEYSWRRGPGPYRTTIGPSDSTYYTTWQQVYAASYGDNLDSSAGQTITGNYADDPSALAFPQGNWGHLLTALSYAVDHGAAGAQAGYTRISTAGNWSSNAARFNDWPQYGVLPR